MDPDWLSSVVCEQRPDTDVLCGAFIVDDVLRADRTSSGSLPRMSLRPWSREVLQRAPQTDIGAIAHRRELPEARFYENLRGMEDWALLLRLTVERDPLVLPALACYYTTDAPNRATNASTDDADHALVLERASGVRGQQLGNS